MGIVTYQRGAQRVEVDGSDRGLGRRLVRDGWQLAEAEPLAPPAGPDEGLVQDLIEWFGAERRTVEQVLERVGDDPALAVVALDLERSDTAPRSTLIGALEDIIDAQESAG